MGRDDLSGARFAVILGSGLGGAGDRFSTEAEVPFDAVPGLGPPTVAGHRGLLRRCRVGSHSCLFVLGRRHYYEKAAGALAALVNLIHALAVGDLIVTSAAGALDASLEPGEFMLADQILDVQNRPRPPASASGDLRPARAERGSWPRIGLDAALTSALRRAGARSRVALRRGTLAVTAGPTYETAAEVEALRRAGAAAVAMSCGPEVALAGALGIHVAAIALVTNRATGLSRDPLRHEDVVSCGREAAARLGVLLERFAKGF